MNLREGKTAMYMFILVLNKADLASERETIQWLRYFKTRGETAVALNATGGGTREIMNIIPALRDKGVFIIGVTEREDSPLASASDLVMKIKVEREADSFDMLATTSAMAVVAVFDAAAEHTTAARETYTRRGSGATCASPAAPCASVSARSRPPRRCGECSSAVTTRLRSW